MDIRAEAAEIERRLKEARVSVADMLRLADVDPGSWQRIKNGNRIPRVTTWSRIVSATDKLAPRIGAATVRYQVEAAA